MARTVTDTSVPVTPDIQPGVAAIAASRFSHAEGQLDGDGSANKTMVMAAMHGFAMAVAFLLLFPAGAAAMASRHVGAFRHHWILQVAGMVCVGVGAVLGFVMRPSLGTTHQRLGLATVGAVGLQAVLGVWHHVQYVRSPRRTWMARLHVPLGKTILLAGYAAVLTGLALHHVPVFDFVVVAILVPGEVLWLAIAAARTAFTRTDNKLPWQAAAAAAAQKDTPAHSSEAYQLLKGEEGEGEA